jgi:hypothetical protein
LDGGVGNDNKAKEIVAVFSLSLLEELFDLGFKMRPISCVDDAAQFPGF